MQKDFDSWNKEKKKLHLVGFEHLRFHEREIWWCSLGINLGDEEDGKNQLFERPILVVKKFNDRLAWAIPMTTKLKSSKYYYVIHYKGKNFSLILSQLRLVSVKRFRRLIRKLPNNEFLSVPHSLATLIKAE